LGQGQSNSFTDAPTGTGHQRDSIGMKFHELRAT
jgi:hypothetical protein